jgi:hypothetical protein
MQKSKSVILGSFILYILDNLIETKDKSKGSVIRLKQKLNAKIRHRDNTPLVSLSNDVWSDTIAVYKDNNYRLHISDAIEFLVYEDSSFAKVFGEEILDLTFKAVIKITESNTPKEVIQESREICKTLIDLTRKYSFEYCNKGVDDEDRNAN